MLVAFKRAIIITKNSKGEVITVRYSSTFYRSERAARDQYGDSFLRLHDDSVHEVEVYK